MPFVFNTAGSNLIWRPHISSVSECAAVHPAAHSLPLQACGCCWALGACCSVQRITCRRHSTHGWLGRADGALQQERQGSDALVFCEVCVSCTENLHRLWRALRRLHISSVGGCYCRYRRLHFFTTAGVRVLLGACLMLHCTQHHMQYHKMHCWLVLVEGALQQERRGSDAL